MSIKTAGYQKTLDDVLDKQFAAKKKAAFTPEVETSSEREASETSSEQEANEWEGGGGYRYRMEDGGIRIVKSPQGGEGFLVTKDNEFYQTILNEKQGLASMDKLGQQVREGVQSGGGDIETPAAAAAGGGPKLSDEEIVKGHLRSLGLDENIIPSEDYNKVATQLMLGQQVREGVQSGGGDIGTAAAAAAGGSADMGYRDEAPPTRSPRQGAVMTTQMDESAGLLTMENPLGTSVDNIEPNSEDFNRLLREGYRVKETQTPAAKESEQVTKELEESAENQQGADGVTMVDPRGTRVKVKADSDVFKVLLANGYRPA